MTFLGWVVKIINPSILRPVNRRFSFLFHTAQTIVQKIFIFFSLLHFSSQKTILG